MKVCTKCTIKKSLSQFYKDKQKKDSLSSHCKTCINITSKNYQKTHKVERQLYSKQHGASRYSNQKVEVNNLPCARIYLKSLQI